MRKQLSTPLTIALLVILTLVAGTYAQVMVDLTKMVFNVLPQANGGMGAAGPPYSIELLTTNIVDGLSHTVTAASGSYNAADGYSDTMVVNVNPSQSAALSVTLPVANIGITKCVVNSDVGGTSETGVITVHTSGTGQYIHLNGTKGSSGGSAVSPGDAGDKACFRGWSATDWEMYAQSSGWTNP
jgi:hypothetical protein